MRVRVTKGVEGVDDDAQQSGAAGGRRLGLRGVLRGVLMGVLMGVLWGVLMGVLMGVGAGACYVCAPPASPGRGQDGRCGAQPLSRTNSRWLVHRCR